jgi:hypothetical protein
VQQWHIGDWTVTRVPDPGFELVLPVDEATAAALKQSPWLHPNWVTDAWELRVGSSAILLTGHDRCVLVDPWLAFDDPAKTEPRLASLEAAGVKPDEVDTVVYSHIDGIGAGLRGDGPSFPNARYLIPAEELPGAGALAALANIEAITTAGPLAPEVELESLPGHNAAHYGVRIAGDALIAGHLFLHPAQVAIPENTNGDPNPGLIPTRTKILSEGVLLIGPLFAEPGGGRLMSKGGRWALA